jgi:hypothetical protein
MTQTMTENRLQKENRRYVGTGGVSQENRQCGFMPAFHDRMSGRTELSRFTDGSPAPIHMLVALPDDWVTKRDASGQVIAVKGSVIAGFVMNDRFYTRAEAARLCYH